MIKNVKMVVQGEVDEIVVRRRPGESYGEDATIEACFVLKGDNKEIHAVYQDASWESVSDQCMRGVSGDEVAITGDISIDDAPGGDTVKLENITVTQVESQTTSSYSY